MAKQSDDIRVLYRAFGHSDLPYREVASLARYRYAVAKWPLLARCSAEGHSDLTADRDDTQGTTKDSD